MIFRVKNIIISIFQSISKLRFDLETFVISLFNLVLFIYVYIDKFDSILLKNFKNRTISIATMEGIDVNLRVSLFYWSLLLFFIVFIVNNCLVAYIMYLFRKQNEKYRINFIHEKNFICIFSVIGIMQIVFMLFGSEVKYALSIVIILFLITLVSMVLKVISCRKNNNTLKIMLDNFKITKWLYIFSFSITLISSNLCFYKFNIKITHLVFIKEYLVSIICTSILTYILIYFLSKRNIESDSIYKIIIKSSLLLFSMPIISSICNELYLILNQHNIFIMHPERTYCIILILIILFTIFYFIYKTKKTMDNKLDKESLVDNNLLTRVYYPLLIIMIGFILAQPSVSVGQPGELFESANAGVGIQQLFQYGKIPIVETFGAHFLSEQFWGIIYSILNGFNGGAFVLYNGYDNIIILLIAYYFLNNIVSRDYSLLLVLFLPILFNLLPSYYIYSLLGIFVLKLLMKNGHKFLYNVLFWFVLFFIFIWRADLGFASMLSAIGVYLILKIIYKEKIHFKKFIGSFAIVGTFLLGIFTILSLIKDINPIMRIKEILNFLASNQAWGYTTVGNQSTFKYYIYYAIFPITILLIFVYILYKLIIKKEKYDMKFIITIIFLLLFQIFNFQRALVRHSLVENQDMIINAFTFLIFSCIPFIITKENSNFKKIILFLCISSFSIYFILLGSNSVKIANNSNFENSVTQYNTFNNYGGTNKKINRYVEDKVYAKNTYSDFNKILGLTLKKNETFIDYSNEDYLYVLTNRITPMYANQTPAYLSDEISQKNYLSEISKYSIPYVVYSTNKKDFKDTDGVADCIRSYRVSEYINSNYEPFITADGLNIWVKKNKLIEFKNKISKAKGIDFTYQVSDISNGLNKDKMDIGLIPYYWGQYDSNNVLLKSKPQIILGNKDIIKKDSIKVYPFKNIFNKKDGNYVHISAKSSIDSNVVIEYGFNDGNKIEQKGSFKIKVLGNNTDINYLVRVSCQYNWINSDLNYISIYPENNLDIEKIEIRTGD